MRLFERLAGLAAAGMADTITALTQAGTIDADGASSTANWITTHTGRSARDAARLARLSVDLPDLPHTRTALAAGTITDEAADAIVKAARDGRLGPPHDVDRTLADIATSSSPEQLRSDVRDRQQAVDAAAMLTDETRQHARRSLRMWRKSTGMWKLSGDLPDEVGQTFRTALDTFDHPDPPDTDDPSRRRPDQRLADALATMTHTVLDRGLAPETGGVARPHLSVIVTADTISTDLTDLTDPDATDATGPDAAPTPDDARWADLTAGELPWGGKLSPQAIRRICCDAAVTRIVMDADSQVLDVGRATRNWSGPQRRVVNARDRSCRGPNCTRPIAWTHIHHLQWWRHDGPTAVDNGLALCHHCHRLVHDHGWTVHHDVATSVATWTSPTGDVTTTRPGQPTRTVRTGRAGPPGQPHRTHQPGKAGQGGRRSPEPGRAEVDDDPTAVPIMDASGVRATRATTRHGGRAAGRAAGGIARP